MSDLPALEIPAIAELASYERWVLWRTEERAGKATKAPLQTNGRRASSTDPATWTSYERACRAFVSGLGNGLGFVFTDTLLAGIDLDGCAKPGGGLTDEGAEIVRTMRSYTEVSPSGRGLHIIVRAALPGPGIKRPSIELYDTGRYFTVTGRPWPGAPETIEPRQPEVETLYASLAAETGQRASGRKTPRVWSGELPESVRIATKADATVRLLLSKAHEALGYASASEADFALACTLLESGFDAADTEAALRWRHAHVEPRPKSLDYFPRTVVNAQARLATQQAAR